VRLVSRHSGRPRRAGHRGPAAARSYLGPRLSNTPERHPEHVEPGTAMPELGVTDGDARDIAAFLYTLR
jgi:cytochrome c